MITKKLLEFTLMGADWILYLLLFLSVVSIGMMLERAITFQLQRIDIDAFLAKLQELLRANKREELAALVAKTRSPVARVVAAGLTAQDQGPASTEEILQSAAARERLRLEHNLSFLGTMGNNAPFIGLFGTVLGIIKAFADLAGNVRGGASAVMGGISEALVATAVGLIVALPAVVAYNLCKKTVRQVTTNAEVLTRTILVHVPERDKEGG